MADREPYVIPDVVGGLGDGSSPENAYSSLNTAEAAEQDDFVTDMENIKFLWYNTDGLTNDTTAVVIDGSTLSQIYDMTIECQQDNGGKWDDSVVKLQAANTHVLTVSDGWVTLEKMQIEITATNASYQTIINFTVVPNLTDVYVNNCLLKGVGQAVQRERGIGITNNTAKVKIKNSAIWNIGTEVVHANNTAVYINGGLLYMHNCTVSGGYNNTSYVAGTMQAKNTIFCNAANTVAGTWTSSDYNTSDKAATTGGAHDQVNQAFTFVDSGAGDYHLDAADTGAQDFGTDLSADADLPVTDDIDGDARDGSTPDCGLDEYATAGTQYDVDIADTINITDAMSTTAQYNKSIADDVGIGDVLSIQSAYGKTVSETIGITDTIITEAEYRKSFSEAISISDFMQTKTTYNKSISDSIGIGDIISRAVGYVKTFPEAVGITDAINALVIKAINIYNTIGIADTFSRAVNYVKTVSDSVSISDIFSRAINYARTVLDSIGIIDLIRAIIEGIIPGTHARIFGEISAYKIYAETDYIYFSGGIDTNKINAEVDY